MSLDVRRLDDLVDFLGRETTADMVAKAVDGLRRNMAELRTATDPAQTKRFAHTIKGLAAMYGLNDIVAMAAKIEGSDFAASATLVFNLDQLTTDGVRDLTSFMSRLGAAG